MKATIYDKTGKEKSSLELPARFSSAIRRDILAKVFEAQKRKQPMGTQYRAGWKYSASGKIKHRRHAWKTAYGKGISRIPRKIMSRHGVSFNWIGATVPGTKGGRRAHPPKYWENQFKKVNKKELQIAIDSALAGTVDKKSMEKKYGFAPQNTAVVFDAAVLATKTSEFIEMLEKVYGNAFDWILQHKTVRAGRGKLRGRKYKSNAGLVFVTGSDEKMKRKGIDTVSVKELTVRDLAPNGQPGRFAAYTEKAIKELSAEAKR